jgi:hypothetical protein
MNLHHGVSEINYNPVVIRPLRFRVNSYNINKAASRSARPSACVVMAAAINPFMVLRADHHTAADFTVKNARRQSGQGCANLNGRLLRREAQPALDDHLGDRGLPRNQ